MVEREMQDNYHHTTHMIQYALSLLQGSWWRHDRGLKKTMELWWNFNPTSRGRSRKTMGFEVITSISPFLVILWGMIWASLIKGSQLEDEAWAWKIWGLAGRVFFMGYRWHQEELVEKGKLWDFFRGWWSNIAVETCRSVEGLSRKFTLPIRLPEGRSFHWDAHGVAWQKFPTQSR